jgi:hypothetical protein
MRWWLRLNSRTLLRSPTCPAVWNDLWGRPAREGCFKNWWGAALTQPVTLYARTRGFPKLCVTAHRRPPLWPRLGQLTLMAPTSLPLRLATYFEFMSYPPRDCLSRSCIASLGIELPSPLRTPLRASRLILQTRALCSWSSLSSMVKPKTFAHDEFSQFDPSRRSQEMEF